MVSKIKKDKGRNSGSQVDLKLISIKDKKDTDGRNMNDNKWAI